MRLSGDVKSSAFNQLDTEDSSNLPAKHGEPKQTSSWEEFKWLP
eukprot:CAMPEP_0172626050 /NCGR_PEP_ID=MMETSP1068-20121228/147601_1 /TAXON_ID=35684 /ORGANISM="Pseudopedinella elastica, Strain CCMP716" /LENGTH=43 /DNA_ID= /DNA_START= /DNA_END= /DNA_ORIENTATION=